MEKGNAALVIGGALLLGVAGVAGFFLYKNYKGEAVFAGLGQHMPIDSSTKDYNARKMEAYWARRAEQRNDLRNQQIRSYLQQGGSYV
jgi:hypothetical protein